MKNQNELSLDKRLSISFKEIAKSKPIEKITIKEITDHTGVIRPTFYNYFQDKYELLEWIVKNELILPCQSKMFMMRFEDGVIGLLETIALDAKFYQNCIRLEGQNSFNEILSNSIRNMILEFVNEDILRERLWFKWLTPRVIANFFAESVTYAVVEWIKTDMEVPKEEIWECFLYLTNHSILEMIVGVYKEGIDSEK